MEIYIGWQWQSVDLHGILVCTHYYLSVAFPSTILAYVRLCIVSFFFVFDTVVFLFLFDKYYLIMDYLQKIHLTIYR